MDFEIRAMGVSVLLARGGADFRGATALAARGRLAYLPNDLKFIKNLLNFRYRTATKQNSEKR
jgi:hypothetical protein